jgi:hypothetical protein
MRGNSGPQQPWYLPVPDPTKLTTDAVSAAEQKIRELYDLRFELTDRALQQRFDAQSKSLDAALISADLKSNALSDKIGQISLDLKGNITRAEFENQLRELGRQIEDLRQYRDMSSGRSSGADRLWGLIVGGVGLLVAVVSVVYALSGR